MGKKTQETKQSPTAPEKSATTKKASPKASTTKRKRKTRVHPIEMIPHKPQKEEDIPVPMDLDLEPSTKSTKQSKAQESRIILSGDEDIEEFDAEKENKEKTEIPTQSSTPPKESPKKTVTSPRSNAAGYYQWYGVHKQRESKKIDFL